MPLISVILPTYNRKDFLTRALASVLTQSWVDLEILVIDDSSSDGTAEYVKRLAQKDSRVRLFQHSYTQGSQSARNTGVQAARGEYMAFLDSDNAWLPEKLFLQMNCFLKHTTVGAVYCGYRRITPSYRSGEWTPLYRGNVHQKALEGWMADLNTLVVKSEQIRKIGGFDEKIRAYQEWDLTIRLSQEATFDYCPECLVLYYEDAPNRISSNALQNASGHLDVVEAHREAILKKCGSHALSQIYYQIGQQMLIANQFVIARLVYQKALQLSSI